MEIPGVDGEQFFSRPCMASFYLKICCTVIHFMHCNLSGNYIKLPIIFFLHLVAFAVEVRMVLFFYPPCDAFNFTWNGALLLYKTNKVQHRFSNTHAIFFYFESTVACCQALQSELKRPD